MINYNIDKNPFVIEDDTFDPDYFGKTEVVMALGNGYLGTRSTHEENYAYQIRNTFINGTFNKATPDEVTELPNFPDVIQLIIKVDGQLIDLLRIPFQDYRKRLHLDKAVLERTFKVTINKKKIELNFQRFVSWDNDHLIASRLLLKSSHDVEVEIISAIDGTLTNSGSMHFVDGQLSILGKDTIKYLSNTTESKIEIAIHLKSRFNQKEIKTLQHTHRRMAQVSYFFDNKKDELLVFDRIAHYQSSRDLEPITEAELDDVLKQTYDTLFDAHLKQVQHYWNHQKITIESTEPFHQVAILFAQYHLKIMTPYHDFRLGIGAKGLTGEGYKGHSFWDTEIFIFPYFLYTQPQVARNLLKFRYLGLEKAKEKAEKNGFKGAQYPWEMAWYSEGEVTPEWGGIDVKSGKQTKIWSGFIEQHITGDIIYALIRYLEVTNDNEFLKDCGLEMILETAIFWSTRAEYNTQLDRYELKDVIGADEYKEHVDNNAFTNYIAHFNLKTAADYYHQYKHEEWAVKVIEKTEYNQHVKLVETVRDKIYLPLPNNEGIIPQDDTYLSLPVIELKKYKSHPKVGTLFQDYSLSQVNKMQISKQADVLMLWHLFPDQFSEETLHKNFEYYEQKTLHDSSLSLSTHAILANQINQEKLALQLFGKASRIDLGPYMKSSDHGIHAASLGGIWQTIFFGFAGIRFIDNQIFIAPKLPAEISTISLPITIQGKEHRFLINHNEIKVFDKNHQEKLKINYQKGKKISLKGDKI